MTKVMTPSKLIHAMRKRLGWLRADSSEKLRTIMSSTDRSKAMKAWRQMAYGILQERRRKARRS